VIDVKPAKQGVENPQRRRTEKRPFASWAQLEGLAARLGFRHGPMVIFAAATGLRLKSGWLEQRDIDREAKVAYVSRALHACQVTDVQPLDVQWTSGTAFRQPWTTGTAAKQAEFESPLPDSNRRPPPYHGAPAASAGNRRQRFCLPEPFSPPSHLPPVATSCDRSAP
jgi:hypothetical protein